jgi:hypothetical protein
MRVPIQIASLAFLLVTAVASAQRTRVKSYPDERPSAEEMAQRNTRAKQQVNTYTEDPENRVPKERPFDWRPIGFTVLTFAVVTPFALRAYRKAAEEQASVTASSRGGAKRRSKL